MPLHRHQRAGHGDLGTDSGAEGLFPAMDPLRIAVFLLLVVTISRIHYHVPLLTALRPALLLTAFIVVWIVLFPRLVSPGLIVREWPGRVVLGLGVMACLSVPTALSIGGSASFLLNAYFKVLFFIFVLFSVLRTTRDLYAFVWAYVVSCGILAWSAIFLFDLQPLEGDTLRLGRMHTWDSNDLAALLTVGLPLTLLTLQTSRRPGKILSGAVLLGIGVALARTGSRGGFVGLVATGLALLVLLKTVPAVKRVALLAAVVGGLTVAAPPGYWDRMATILEFKDDYNWDQREGRRAVALRGMGYMLDNPLTGVGIDNFTRAEGTISEDARRWVPGMPGVRWTSPHNSYVQVGAELGIPGLLLFVILVVGGVVGGVRQRSRLPVAWATGPPEERFLYMATMYLPVAFVGFAVTALFLSFAYIAVIYILAAYLVGLRVCIEGKLGRAAPTTSRRRARAHLG